MQHSNPLMQNLNADDLTALLLEAGVCLNEEEAESYILDFDTDSFRVKFDAVIDRIEFKDSIVDFFINTQNNDSIAPPHWVYAQFELDSNKNITNIKIYDSSPSYDDDFQNETKIRGILGDRLLSGVGVKFFNTRITQSNAENNGFCVFATFFASLGINDKHNDFVKALQAYSSAQNDSGKDEVLGLVLEEAIKELCQAYRLKLQLESQLASYDKEEIFAKSVGEAMTANEKVQDTESQLKAAEKMARTLAQNAAAKIRELKTTQQIEKEIKTKAIKNAVQASMPSESKIFPKADIIQDKPSFPKSKNINEYISAQLPEDSREQEVVLPQKQIDMSNNKLPTATEQAKPVKQTVAATSTFNPHVGVMKLQNLNENNLEILIMKAIGCDLAMARKYILNHVNQAAIQDKITELSSCYSYDLDGVSRIGFIVNAKIETDPAAPDHWMFVEVSINKNKSIENVYIIDSDVGTINYDSDIKWFSELLGVSESNINLVVQLLASHENNGYYTLAFFNDKIQHRTDFSKNLSVLAQAIYTLNRTSECYLNRDIRNNLEKDIEALCMACLKQYESQREDSASAQVDAKAATAIIAARSTELTASVAASVSKIALPQPVSLQSAAAQIQIPPILLNEFKLRFNHLKFNGNNTEAIVASLKGITERYAEEKLSSHTNNNDLLSNFIANRDNYLNLLELNIKEAKFLLNQLDNTVLNLTQSEKKVYMDYLSKQIVFAEDAIRWHSEKLAYLHDKNGQLYINIARDVNVETKDRDHNDFTTVSAKEAAKTFIGVQSLTVLPPLLRSSERVNAADAAEITVVKMTIQEQNGSPEFKSVTVITRNGNAVKAEFHYDPEKLKHFLNKSKLPLHESPIMEMVAQNVKNYYARESVTGKSMNLDFGIPAMEKELAHAFILYCAFGGYQLEVPPEYEGYKQQIKESGWFQKSQLELFTTAWKKSHPYDQGIREIMKPVDDLQGQENLSARPKP